MNYLNIKASKFKTARLFQAVLMMLIIAICGELFARYYLGLGTPPLYKKHPTIEYMLKPNQDVFRFGNQYVVNDYGMRSNLFPQSKDRNEFRIMIFGDSVLNGGNLTDHTELATSILKGSLSQSLFENTVVGNISAGSWGPGNWLAYADEYGFFDADIVGLVISSHDYKDNPRFLPLEKNHPNKRPISALYEGFNRYFIERYVPKVFSSFNSRDISDLDEETEISRGLRDLKEFLTLARTNTDGVIVFQHWTREELKNNEFEAGHSQIKELCEQLGIKTVQLGPIYSRAIGKGISPYRDGIHLNSEGQKLMASAIYEAVTESLHVTNDSLNH